MDKRDIDMARIDDAVLALMHLTLHRADPFSDRSRAWKSFDWETLARLHEQGLIDDPVGKARSVVLTEEGARRSEALFYQLFSRGE